MYKIGDKIKIINMVDEPQYKDKEGVIEYIDSIGQLHGSWGGCAIIPRVQNTILVYFLHIYIFFCTFVPELLSWHITNIFCS